MHQILKKWSCLISALPNRLKKLQDWMILKTFWLQLCFVLKRWVLTWGVYAIKINQQKLLHFIKKWPPLIFFLLWLSLGQFLIELSPSLSYRYCCPAIDIADTTHLIELLKSLICCKRSTVDTFRKTCYSYIVELACKVGIEECKPRTSKLQWNHNNIPSE